MAGSLVIEEESGIYSGRSHPHNGYYAGDFSALPVRTDLSISTLWVTPVSAPANRAS